MDLRELFQRQGVLPAPMCGISDYPFRELCRRMGAELTTTQMVSAEGIVRGDTHSLSILDLNEDRGEPPEPALMIQLFGGDPEAMGEAARRLEAAGAAVIDFNMGCPAHKITSSQSGSALLKDLPRVGLIFRSLRRATTLPLTVKMRWDWGEGEGAALEVARMAESEGFEAVCLHARTRAQGYSGQAQWGQIGRLCTAVKIPVIGNGDIRTPADALAMRAASGCAAVMIGRALIGDPWLLGETLAALRTGAAEPARRAPAWPERRRMMIEHARMMFERRGPRGLVLFRKHAAAYLRALPGAKHARERLMHVSSFEQLAEALGE